MVSLKGKLKKTVFRGGGSGFVEAAKYTLCVVLILIGGLIYIWPQIRVVKLGYERDELQKQYNSLLQTNHLMRIEVANLRSMKKIETIARNRLKMDFPEDSRVVIVRMGLKKESADLSPGAAGQGDKKTDGVAKKES
ncbi:MAG: cell division protein FtsL [Nitrospinae bacterium]|nr:cell division protein FtsL [Nitrospinota bacterium]